MMDVLMLALLIGSGLLVGLLIGWCGRQLDAEE